MHPHRQAKKPVADGTQVQVPFFRQGRGEKRRCRGPCTKPQVRSNKSLGSMAAMEISMGFSFKVVAGLFGNFGVKDFFVYCREILMYCNSSVYVINLKVFA